MLKCHIKIYFSPHTFPTLQGIILIRFLTGAQRKVNKIFSWCGENFQIIILFVSGRALPQQPLLHFICRPIHMTGRHSPSHFNFQAQKSHRPNLNVVVGWQSFKMFEIQQIDIKGFKTLLLHDDRLSPSGTADRCIDNCYLLNQAKVCSSEEQ